MKKQQQQQKHRRQRNRRRNRRRRNRQSHDDAPPLPHDFLAVYKEFLENLLQTLSTEYTDLIRQRLVELQNPGQARVLFEDFQAALALIQPAIAPRDETALLRCPKDVELIRGIDFRVVYPTFSDASKQNFWMFLQILSLMTTANPVLWDNVMTQMKTLHANEEGDEEEITAENLSQKVKELCGFRGETQSEQIMEGLITDLTSQVIENPIAVLQGLQNPAALQQMFGNQMAERLNAAQVSPEEMQNTVQNLANSIGQQMPDFLQNLMPPQSQQQPQHSAEEKIKPSEEKKEIK